MRRPIARDVEQRRRSVSTPASRWVSFDAQSFSPLEFPDLISWWDADDAETFTYSSGTVVSQWDDKSGNGYHLVQASSTNQPSRSGTVNGRSTVVFDGNDSLSVASFDMTGSQQFTVATVFTATAGSDDIVAEHSTNFNANDGAWIMFRASTNIVQVAKKDVNAYASFNTSATVTTTPSIVIGTHDGTLSTDETSVWVNASGSGSRPFNSNTIAGNLSDTLFVGARAGTSFFLDGQIAELIIWNRSLDTAERQELETYLARKWGVNI